MATATIGRSIIFLPREFANHFARHRVTAEDLRALHGDRPVHAWPLADLNGEEH